MKPWPTVRLGEVLKEQDSSVPVSELNEVNLAGVYSFARGLFKRGPMLSGETSYKSYNRLVPDDFVISVPKAWEGALARVTPEFEGWFLSPVFPTFRANRVRLEPAFLEWFCKRESVWTQLQRKSRGIGARRESVHPKQFLSLEIPLPPLAEQRRVVARIEELAAQIHEASTLRHQAAEETEALYSQQLGVAMTPHGEGWKRETVADVIKSMDAGWSPQCDDIPAGDGKWGVLKTTAVQWCDFQPQHNKTLPATLKPIPEFSVKEGDVLVTRAGPRKRVAVVAAVRRGEPRLTISDKLIRLRTDRTKIEPRFLELSLASPFSQEHLVQRKTGLADAQVNISQTILKATPIAFPPLPEQRRIVAELDALQAEVDGLKRLQAETAQELNALLPSILDRAFKGEL
jgi:type I restriction enzyme, S subunit